MSFDERLDKIQQRLREEVAKNNIDCHVHCYSSLGRPMIGEAKIEFPFVFDVYAESVDDIVNRFNKQFIYEN